jgi:sugar fermentation stimulation protein A
MNFAFTPLAADFLERPNRFVIIARIHSTGEIVRAHCPNPGRMKELLVPGAIVYLTQSADPTRRTAYTLRFVQHPANGQLISLNTQLPNALFAEGLSQGFFPQFDRFSKIRREVSLPHEGKTGINSRIDFQLTDGHGRICWVEVKSVTLVESRIALFPDAPTVRGRRHVDELVEQVQQGAEAAVVFIVQRPDADILYPNWDTDPAFSQSLHEAERQGLRLYACTCRINLAHAHLERQIQVSTARAGSVQA